MEHPPLSFCMILCSRRRPALVASALTSISNLEIPAGVSFSVLLVENDTTPQYADIVYKFKDTLSLHYEVEPEPGLTYVRNHALSSAEKMGVDWIGSIDDDVTISEDWLVHMVSAIRKYNDTQIFYGNWVRHNHPDEPDWHPSAFHYNPNPTGRKIMVSSFNNIAVKAVVFASDGMAVRFDHRFRFTGGEDSDYTRTFLERGGVIRSVHEARGDEYNSEDRADFTERMHRASSIEYSCAKIRHKHDPAIIAAGWSLQTIYRSLVFGIVNITVGALAMPFNKLWGLKRYGAARQYFAGVHGALRYYFGSDPELYRDEGT